MTDLKYLLYIDILGFSNLVKSDYLKIRKIFSIIDSLNAHKDRNFKTIVFSDTILIHNTVAPKSTGEHEEIVMFLCEFVQDLIFRCRNMNIQFKAILTYGEFYYEKLKNIEAYHGIALIKAYNKEKEINGMWLFIEKNVQKYNRIFPAVSFDEDLCFVFLLQGLERINRLEFSKFPIDRKFIFELQEYFTYDYKEEVEILKTLKENIDSQSDSRIRGKYLQTYFLFKNRYQTILSYLEINNFDYRSISPDADWDYIERPI